MRKVPTRKRNKLPQKLKHKPTSTWVFDKHKIMEQNHQRQLRPTLQSRNLESWNVKEVV